MIGEVLDHIALPEAVTVVRDVAADLPFVRGDPVLLHHVLANLVDNALRNARAQVTVAVRGEGARVWLSVEDDGTRAPTAERELIFERFRRIEGRTGRMGVVWGLPSSRTLPTRRAGIAGADSGAMRRAGCGGFGSRRSTGESHLTRSGRYGSSWRKIPPDRS